MNLTINELLSRVIGHTDAVGETYYDIESIKNIDILRQILFFSADRLLDNYKMGDRPEYSIQQIKEASESILREWYEELDSYFSEDN